MRRLGHAGIKAVDHPGETARPSGIRAAATHETLRARTASTQLTDLIDRATHSRRGTLINDAAADKINNFALRWTIFHLADSIEKETVIFLYERDAFDQRSPTTNRLILIHYRTASKAIASQQCVFGIARFYSFEEITFRSAFKNNFFCFLMCTVMLPWL